MARTERAPTYGDNSFKGNGRLLCAACHTPLREHRVGFPCPELGAGIFTVEAPIKRARKGEGLDPETVRRRELRRRKREEQAG